MSIVEDNVITRLNYNRKEVGRKVKYSKQYHQWEFILNGRFTNFSGGIKFRINWFK